MYDNSINCPTPESHNWGCGCPTDRLPARSQQEAEAILHEAMDHGVYDPAVRQKLIDQLTEACRHEAAVAPPAAGIRDTARQATGQPVCVHPEGYEGECPCTTGCVCCKATPAAGQPATQQTDRATVLREEVASLFRQPPGAERLGDATPGEIADAVAAVFKGHQAAILAECDAMEQAMANGHASLSRLREHIARIRRVADEAAQ